MKNLYIPHPNKHFAVLNERYEKLFVAFSRAFDLADAIKQSAALLLNKQSCSEDLSIECEGEHFVDGTMLLLALEEMQPLLEPLWDECKRLCDLWPAIVRTTGSSVDVLRSNVFSSRRLYDEACTFYFKQKISPLSDYHIFEYFLSDSEGLDEESPHQFEETGDNKNAALHMTNREANSYGWKWCDAFPNDKRIAMIVNVRTGEKIPRSKPC